MRHRKRMSRSPQTLPAANQAMSISTEASVASRKQALPQRGSAAATAPATSSIGKAGIGKPMRSARMFTVTKVRPNGPVNSTSVYDMTAIEAARILAWPSEQRRSERSDGSP